MTTLTVKHDTTEYKIPIEIEYRCWECLDLGFISHYAVLDDWREVKCPFCYYGENEMDDDD